MECRRGRHVVYLMHCHLIFVTKYRGKVLSAKALKKMRELMESICAKNEVELVEFNGEVDHVHLLINYPPKVQISRLVNALKSITSRELKRHFPELNQVAWRKHSLWSPSYFAGSVGGAPIEILKHYIQQQDTPH